MMSAVHDDRGGSRRLNMSKGTSMRKEKKKPKKKA